MASANAFDFKLFKRLLEFTKPYRLVFYFVAFTALILSGLAILRPYFLERAIDESIIPRDPSGLIYFIVIMIGVLVLEVIFQFSFIFYANWLGQHIIKDIRISLFGLMMRFKMKYFEELKYEEMSVILGTSVGALKASYHLAVKKIEIIIKYIYILLQ